MPPLTLQPRGPAGFEGYSVLSAIPPRDPVRGDGKDGDFWVNQRTGGFFRRSQSAWRLQFSMIGTKGDKGDQGITGKQVLSGNSAPGPLTGVDGDFYLQLAGAGAPLLYGPKSLGSWPSGISLVGPLPFTVVAPWAPTTTYTNSAPISVVTQSGSTYSCLISHTSGSNFAVDLAAGRWQVIAQKGADGTGVGNVNSTGVIPAGNLVMYADSTGNLIQDSGVVAADVARAAVAAKLFNAMNFS